VSKDPAMRMSESNFEAKGMERATANKQDIVVDDGVFEIDVAIDTSIHRNQIPRSRTRLEFKMTIN